MNKMNIMFLAPVKKGGPYLSLKKLSHNMNSKNLISGDFYASFKGFLYAIVTRKYDLIHTVLPVPFNIWGTPIILNIKGNYKKEKGIKNLLGYLYPISIFFSKIIISPSRYMMKKLNIKSFEIIPNSVDFENLKLQKKIYQIDKKNVKLVILTSFKFYEKGSGVINLINILNKLDSKINFELKIIGGGEYLNLIKSEVDKIKLKNIKVIWFGHLENPHLEIITSDIFTYYSNLDNYPNAVLEAMALKIPLISNDVGAVSEFLPDSMIGFNINDYKNKLDRLISNYQKPKQYNLLSFEKMTQLYLKVYNQFYKK